MEAQQHPFYKVSWKVSLDWHLSWNNTISNLIVILQSFVPSRSSIVRNNYLIWKISVDIYSTFRHEIGNCIRQMARRTPDFPSRNPNPPLPEVRRGFRKLPSRRALIPPNFSLVLLFRQSCYKERRGLKRGSAIRSRRKPATLLFPRFPRFSPPKLSRFEPRPI